MDQVSELRRKLAVLRAYVLGTLTVTLLIWGGCAFSKIDELNGKLDKIEPIGKALVDQLAAFNQTFKRAVDWAEGNPEDPGIKDKVDEVIKEAGKLRNSVTGSEDTLREFMGLPPKEREDDEDE